MEEVTVRPRPTTAFQKSHLAVSQGNDAYQASLPNSPLLSPWPEAICHAMMRPRHFAVFSVIVYSEIPCNRVGEAEPSRAEPQQR